MWNSDCPSLAKNACTKSRPGYTGFSAKLVDSDEACWACRYEQDKSVGGATELRYVEKWLDSTNHPEDEEEKLDLRAEMLSVFEKIKRARKDKGLLANRELDWEDFHSPVEKQSVVEILVVEDDEVEVDSDDSDAELVLVIGEDGSTSYKNFARRPKARRQHDNYSSRLCELQRSSNRNSSHE
ncbi:hypothetical protein UCRPC4_g02168 [Phaeomoniella chlamydospora]|uniref:Uncharacterized protein n=1 Tax=Phaeomoniella chlamydospora TaxID=158046 RepID=A0A0G2EQD1_PHACM|nr:hypothetical protein UCRPC4_g02168 [Phaeomoniella chlamydospora]